MPYFVVILHDVTFYHEHPAVVNVADVSGLILFQSRAITICDDFLAGLGCIEISFVKHVFDSKEF